MWTYIELTSAADQQERLGVIASLAMPCLITRGAAPYRRAASSATSPGHQSRGRRRISGVRWPWQVLGRHRPRVETQRTAASAR